MEQKKKVSRGTLKMFDNCRKFCYNKDTQKKGDGCMLEVTIQVKYTDENESLKISHYISYKVPYDKLLFCNDCVSIFDMYTGDYLAYKKDRIVYLRVERADNDE